MRNKFKQLIRTEFRKSNVKAFTFFLIFSSFIWLMVQLSKPYSKVIHVPLTFENYPKDKVINTHSEKIEMQVNQSGYQLTWFRINRPKISIDLSELPVEENYLNYRLAEHQAELERLLPIDLNKAEFLEKEIHIPFEMKETKKLPLKSEIEIQFAPGYSSEKQIVFDPDSVMVSGPKSLLDTLTQLYTKPIRRKDVDRDLDDMAALEVPDEQITLFEEKVNYTLEVQKFTEGQIEIPVRLINEPANAEVSLFPPVVEVRFQVSLERYKRIQSADFVVEYDFNDLSDSDSFFIPRIKTQPDFIQNVRFSPRKVEFIIKR